MNTDFAAAYELALRRLQTSDRFEAEIRRALDKFEPEVVERVIERLIQTRLLADERTTQQGVARNEGRRAVGDELLKARLIRRGAPPADVDEAIASTISPEVERAVALLSSKYRDRSAKVRARAARFLYGRGFQEATIETALEEVFGNSTEDSVADVFID